VVATEDALVLQKAEVLVVKKGSKRIIQRIQSIFSQMPMSNIEE